MGLTGVRLSMEIINLGLRIIQMCFVERIHISKTGLNLVENYAKLEL